MAKTSDRMVRAACRSVFNAASLLKGALRRARNLQAAEDTEEVEDLRQTLRKEMDDAETVHQGAAAANLDVSKLREALEVGRLRLSELVAGSSHGGSETAPSVRTEPEENPEGSEPAVLVVPGPSGPGAKGKQNQGRGRRPPPRWVSHRRQ